ncbi:MAG: glycoside hydrolase family 2 TIM barrel-domain containing protein, partial [Candidatus Kappaea frigidicola]|nr:glycoside hydrolase family 2 TIM barrel-domain containing protein [Candidatus Kappaea frigidicola]
MKRTICILMFLCISLFLKSASADTIFLKNGQVVEGIVECEIDEGLIVRISIGHTTICYNDIEKIEKDFTEDNEELIEKWKHLADERQKTGTVIEKAALREPVVEEKEVNVVRVPEEKETKELSRICAIEERIYVDGSLFFIKGMAYGINYPKVPGGMNGYGQIPNEVFEKDFEMMEAAGINCIRTYEPIPIELLDMAYAHGIYVIENIVYPNSETNYESPEELKNLLMEAKLHAQKHMDHPAILMWSLWNDAPFSWGRSGNVVNRYGFETVNNFMREIYMEVKELDKEHLITGSNMLGHEGYDLGFDFLDVIGVNAYIGGHGRWISDEKAKKMVKELVDFSKDYKKPVVILETGYSTYVTSKSRKETQADVLRKQIQVIGEHVAGIFIFQWSDGWWKAGRPDVLDRHIEEHWGIVTGYREPKEGYGEIKRLFNAIPTKSYG